MPRRLRLVLPVVRTKSPLPQRVPSVCVACGGPNLVRFAARSQQIQCRSCGLVSPDFNQPRAPSGYAHDGHADPIDANQARVMLDEMLDALSHDNAKRKLQALQKQARSDVPLLCHFYVPFVVDVCAVVAAKYGFSASMEGVKESLRVLQRHATSEEDGQLTLQLIRLRRVLTPTGAWIQEDAEAEADELKKRADDRERQRRQQEEAARMEELAAENARKARLRAKKIALGLDPSVPRPPQLDAEPPRALIVHAEERVELRVVTRFALAFQWFFQGKPLLPHAGDDELYTGAQRSTLTVRRLTRRFVGDYYCVCTNEEGSVSSSTTRVQMLTELESQRVATRKLKTIPSGHGAVPMELGRAVSLPLSSSSTGGGAPSQPTSPPSLVALCVAGALLLLHAKTLAPAKTVPPIALPAGALAVAVTWLPTAKLLAVVTSTDAKAAKSFELLLFVIDTPSMSTNASPSSPAASSSPTSSSSSSSPAKLVKQSSKTNANAPPPPQVFLSRPLATYTIPATLRSVAFARFLDGGRTLLVSDLHAALFVFELTPTALLCKRVVRYDGPLHPLCHIALTSSTPPGFTPSAGAFVSGFAVCRRNCSVVELLESGREGSKTLRFQAPVHRVAFDRDGFTLAVAESGSIKTWVSIVSLASREPSRARRFIAHVGKISAMQWTVASSLLCTSGYDGYVKLWDLEHTQVSAAGGGSAEPTCVFRVHLDSRGVHSLALLEESDPVAWVAVGFSDCRLHMRALPQLRALEATRSAARDRSASQIQKIVKGRVTRDLINKFIRSGESK